MLHFPVPDVLYCSRYIAESPLRNQRPVKDYEFDFYVGGERDIYQDDVHYHLSRGSLVFRKPGQYIVGYGDYDAYFLTLDFSHKVNIPPQEYLRHRSTPPQEICPLDVLNEIPTVFFPAHPEEITALYEKILRCSFPNPVDADLQHRYVTELLFLILADAWQFHREQAEKNSARETYIQSACRYIAQHYPEPISVDSVAQHVSLTKNYLIRLFRKELDTTPNQYLLETRLFYARSMLLQTNRTVKEIALSCGFHTPSYFIKCFQDRFGSSPLTYKSKYRAESHDPYKSGEKDSPQ